MRRPSRETVEVLATGAAMGLFGVLLARLGNPANSGICVSCFFENLAGSLGLAGNARMAYFRPELAGIAAGAVLAAWRGREWRAVAGRMPLLAFVLGFLLIVGCAVFMGCPIKMVLRLAAGDLTSVAGVAGLAAGIFTGVRYLRAGVDVGTPQPQPAGVLQGALLPVALVALLALSLLPGLLLAAESGPGALHAPFVLSLGAGLALGAMAQRSRFCVTGAFGNLFLARDRTLLMGLGAFLGSAFLLSLALGGFHPGLYEQPGSNPDHLWNFLGMALVGFAAMLAGGCPFRQVVMAGEGKVDAAMVALGMLAGGAIVQRWEIASTSAGPTSAGRVAVLGGLFFCFLVARLNRKEM
jgi:uncharacterized protein